MIIFFRFMRNMAIMCHATSLLDILLYGQNIVWTKNIDFLHLLLVKASISSSSQLLASSLIMATSGVANTITLHADIPTNTEESAKRQKTFHAPHYTCISPPALMTAISEAVSEAVTVSADDPIISQVPLVQLSTFGQFSTFFRDFQDKDSSAHFVSSSLGIIRIGVATLKPDGYYYVPMGTDDAECLTISVLRFADQFMCVLKYAFTFFNYDTRNALYFQNTFASNQEDEDLSMLSLTTKCTVLGKTETRIATFKILNGAPSNTYEVHSTYQLNKLFQCLYLLVPCSGGLEMPEISDYHSCIFNIREEHDIFKTMLNENIEGYAALSSPFIIKATTIITHSVNNYSMRVYISLNPKFFQLNHYLCQVCTTLRLEEEEERQLKCLRRDKKAEEELELKRQQSQSQGQSEVTA